MKRFLFAILCAIITVSSFAQLKVTQNGQVQIGPISQTAVSDSTATLLLTGNGMFTTGSKLIFGKRGHAYIAESSYSVLNTKGALILNGLGGFNFLSNNTSIFSFDNNATQLPGSVKSVMFSVPVSASQYLTTSDARLKTDINTLENYGKGLMQLTPVSYRLIGSELASSKSKEKGNVQFGFLAQDLQKIYPELVLEDTEGNLSIDYIGLIPILVDELQSLENKLAQQQELITTLTPDREKVKSNVDDIEGSLNLASMAQNRPNPFSESTTIECFIPENINDAMICIYNLVGQEVKKIDIKEKGDVNVIISANSFQPGMYIYTLIVDNKEIDSKRMIITE